MQVAGLVHAKVDFTCLHLLNRRSHVHRDRTALGVRHQPSRAQYAAQFGDVAHYVGRGHNHIEIRPPFFLDAFDEVVQADVIGAGRLRFVLFAFVRQHQHAHLLACAVRQRRRAADHLVCVARIDPQPQIYIDRFVEFGQARPRYERAGVFQREGPASGLFDHFGGLTIPFSFFRHPITQRMQCLCP